MGGFVFKLMAALGLDSSEYEDGLRRAEGSASKWGSALGSALSTAGRVLTVTSTAAASSIAALTGAAVNGYADYEQLVGGVETLFGAGGKSLEEYAASVGQTTEDAEAKYNELLEAQNIMLTNADNAWKTSGLSANAYMETVTSFSASLIQSLGGDTVAAAEYADMALRDMSDNANKMGTNMASIQNAYQGFAKQNYTMLDNLKLGYGGTKTEMERLVLDAEKLNKSFKATKDASGNVVLSYADIVEAIHIVQTNMGITGTTAAEAEHTITGSVNSVKAAWQNLVTGIADENADFDTLVSNFADSAIAMLDNMLPRLATALSGAGEMLARLIPAIVEQLPALMDDILPTLIDATVNLMYSLLDLLTSELPKLVDGILPQLIDAALDLYFALADVMLSNISVLLDAVMMILEKVMAALTKRLPTLIPVVVKAIVNLAKTIVAELPTLLSAVLEVIAGLAQGIIDALPILLEALPELIVGIVDFILGAIPQIIEAVISIVDGIVDALPTIIQMIVQMIPQIIQGLIFAILEHLPDITAAGVELLGSMLANTPVIIMEIVQAIPKIIMGIIDALTSPEMVQKIIDTGGELLGKLIYGLTDFGTRIWDACKKIFDAISRAASDMWESIKKIGKNVVEGIWEGIKGGADWIWNKVKEWFGGLFSKIKEFLGIASPSKLFRDVIGKNIVLGLAEGIDDNADTAIGSMLDLADELVQAADIGEVTYRSAIAESKTMGGEGSDSGWIGIGGTTINVYAPKATPAETYAEVVESQQRLKFLGLA